MIKVAIAGRLLSIVDYDSRTDSSAEVGVPEFMKKLKDLGLDDEQVESMIMEKLEYKIEEIMSIGLSRGEAETMVKEMIKTDIESYESSLVDESLIIDIEEAANNE
ncbi:hypothetical protein [Methanobacterium virus PhiF1]|nr:hypothetical protein [Methanobacterium virus PhiF1]